MATLSYCIVDSNSLERAEEVTALYAKAPALGGTDEGAAGERGPSLHFAYFRDLDGNKLRAYCVG